MLWNMPENVATARHVVYGRVAVTSPQSLITAISFPEPEKDGVTSSEI